MTIYRVDRIMMRNLTGNPEDIVPYEDYNYFCGCYSSFELARDYILSETHRMAKKNERITLKELRRTDGQGGRYCGSGDINHADWLYYTPTAVDDGSRFLYLVTEVQVKEDEGIRYKGRKITIEPGP